MQIVPNSSDDKTHTVTITAKLVCDDVPSDAMEWVRKLQAGETNRTCEEDICFFIQNTASFEVLSYSEVEN